MADLRISDLVTASQLKNDDYYEISQSESGTRVSYKATLLAIAVQIATMVDFTSDLNTTSKKITGAINELKNLISLIPQFSIEVVETLPTEDISDTTIYLVPAEDPETGNYYEEYIHVNNAWELVGTTAVDLSDYYTKAQADGKFAVTITNTISPTTTTKKVADIKQNNVTTPVYADDADKVLRAAFGEHEVTGNPVSFDAFLGLEVPSVAEVSFSPIQDLHGYDYPWVGGAGKNKAPLTLANIKALNTYGQWNGNVYTYNGIDYTVNLDEAENVVSIKANGTESSNSSLYFVATGTSTLADYLTNGTNYILSGCTGGSSTAYSIQAQVNGSWYINYGGDTQFTYTSGGTDRLRIYVPSGSRVTNVMFYPMVRLATESDATFAPYENICPISGRTGVELEQMGKNLIVDSIASCSISSAGNLASSTYTTYIIKTKKGARYIASANGETVASYWGEFSTAPAMGSQSISASRYSGNSLTATIDGYIAVAFPSGSTNPMIELGQTITTYEAPITPITHTHTYASTVWWATDDFASGEMDSCGAEIASYNGETLPVGWMSDRDEYAPGTTPTIGAQVVYKNTHTTISTSAEEIELLKGQNVLWTDGDNIKFVYSADIKAYIDSKLA